MAGRPRSPFFVPRPAQDQLWSGIQHSTKALLLVPYEMGNEYFTYRDYIDFDSWSFTKHFNLTLNRVTVAATAIVNGPFYVPRPGDDSFWFSNRSTLSFLAPPSTKPSGGTFYVPRPGDDPYWSGNSLNAKTIYMPTVTVSAKPFAPTIWNFFKASSSA